MWGRKFGGCAGWIWYLWPVLHRTSTSLSGYIICRLWCLRSRLRCFEFLHMFVIPCLAYTPHLKHGQDIHHMPRVYNLVLGLRVPSRGLGAFAHSVW
ncbi:hypothetical protein EDD16DRAFT_1548149 [Pisolithus croceorrhizus]|nr:hypothetical protein EDD16DRAFT_1548149 [Pisolithus croceorrhizus]